MDCPRALQIVRRLTPSQGRHLVAEYGLPTAACLRGSGIAPRLLRERQLQTEGPRRWCIQRLSCSPEVSIAGYPEIVRAQLAIPAELSILCGLAVGYPDPDFAANKLQVSREAIEKNVVFLDS
jgi:hypothetical protein